MISHRSFYLMIIYNLYDLPHLQITTPTTLQRQLYHTALQLLFPAMKQAEMSVLIYLAILEDFWSVQIQANIGDEQTPYRIDFDSALFHAPTSSS